jgi:eukaryotic-like serine/threonine-protein kinase
MTEALLLKAGDLEVDRARRCVLRGSEVIDLPRLSFDFLIALIEAAPAIVTHDELIERVWHNHFVSPETIAQRARLVRVSLGDSANEPHYVAAVRGIGYRWMTPVLPAAPLPNGATDPLPNGAAAMPPRSRLLRYGVPMTGVAIVATLGLWYAQHRDSRWAADNAMPAIEAAIAADDLGTAFERAEALEARIGRGYLSPERWREFAVTTSIRSTPDGARVSYRRYDAPDHAWIDLGETPIDAVRLPRDVLVFNVEKSGYANTQRSQYPPGIYPPDADTQTSTDVVTFDLQPADRVPSGMVWVPASSAPRLPPFVKRNFDVEIPGFLIDRFETTNRDYQDFVDAGGYADARYWQDLEFVDGERVLDRQTALARFVDATGRPGPSNWQLGKYPAGAADLPVTGLSWFEAAAYANFRGKSLPTAYHWGRAVGDSIAAPMTRFGNFTGSVRPVERSGELGPFGTYDMIGNAAEWVSNAKGADRLVSGGAATDPPYGFTSGVAQSPWNRTTLTGVRCVIYFEPPAAALLADLPADELPPLPAPMPDAVLDAALAGLRYRSFDSAPQPIADLQLGDIRRQRVSLSAAGGDGRFDVYVFVPNDAAPPYQAVIYFGGSYGLALGADFEAQFRWDLNAFEPILRSGRVVVWPIWYGTYSRYDGLDEVSNLNDYIAVLQKRFRLWMHETAAVLDYVHAPEFSDKVAWMGISYGAMVPMSMTYHFPGRFGAAILLSGGDLIREPWQVTLYRRLRVPTLMLNGRYDPVVTKGQAQRFYDGIGTPPQDKRLVLYETGHWPLPRNETAREISDWLDRYLGPVEQERTITVSRRPLREPDPRDVGGARSSAIPPSDLSTGTQSSAL